MDSITLENYRCFGEKQTARLAPLTLLVGENSTGKTSFMAMIRVLLDLLYSSENPDFKEAPYDLGSFDEIAHHRGGRGGRADTFEAGFSFRPELENRSQIKFEFTFAQSGTAPVPVRRYSSREEAWIKESIIPGESYALEIGTDKGAWKAQIPTKTRLPYISEDDPMFPPYHFLIGIIFRDDQSQLVKFVPLENSPPFNTQDRISLNRLTFHSMHQHRPFASAPVRSKPRRTYDPSPFTSDPEGEYEPMYLAEMSSKGEEWADLKKRLEDFGKSAGLFDEISIKRLGKKGSDPFQIQVRRFGGRAKRAKGPARNLIDVGYGVSQALPVITELLHEGQRDVFLLQQPEVHLHPSAQAALGSLFCQVAGPQRQLVVETHSDHLIDRVRMDVRDGKSSLKPDDVSILYFERGDLDVRIHSLEIDEEGNLLNAPDNYRNFFMEETSRFLWKR